jgi:hypothetical protein
MDRETYLLHQTPNELAKDLIQYVPFCDTDILFEPFKGEGAFYNNFPAANPKLWCELEQGKDYKDISGGFDWVITNPPFRLDTGGRRVNSFYFLLEYFMERTNKGVAFLANDRCFGTLTPRRITMMNAKGWFIQKIIVCSVKKWRGRYFFIILEKRPCELYKCLPTNY